MRRSIGLVLVGLGVLMLVLAPLSRWYAYPRLAVVSNDVAERVSTGSDVTVLDLGAVVRQEAEVERVTDVRSVRRIIPDQGESTGDTAVWDTSVTTFDELGAGATPEENVLSYVEERVAFDRHTGDSVDGHDQYYTPTGERADRVDVDHEGHYFKLPFGTEQRSYAFWDSTIQEARPLEFQDETTLEGLSVYVFQQVIEPTPVSALEIPGALFGQAGSIVADRIYSNTRTLWVEPHTGAIIKGQEEQDSYLDFEGTRGPTIVQGTLAYTDDQVAANVDEFSSSADRLGLVRDTVPIAAAAGGLVFVALGLLLARRGSYHGRRRSPSPEDGPDGPGGAGAAAAAGVVTRPAAERMPLQQRRRPQEPAGPARYEQPQVSAYDAPPGRYGDGGSAAGRYGTGRYDDGQHDGQHSGPHGDGPRDAAGYGDGRYQGGPYDGRHEEWARPSYEDAVAGSEPAYPGPEQSYAAPPAVEPAHETAHGADDAAPSAEEPAPEAGPRMHTETAHGAALPGRFPHPGHPASAEPDGWAGRSAPAGPPAAAGHAAWDEPAGQDAHTDQPEGRSADPGAPAGETSGERPLDQRSPRPLPRRRPQTGAVRPPVGRQQLQPPTESLLSRAATGSLVPGRSQVAEPLRPGSGGESAESGRPVAGSLRPRPGGESGSSPVAEPLRPRSGGPQPGGEPAESGRPVTGPLRPRSGGPRSGGEPAAESVQPEQAPSDLSRLEQARAELARFAQEHPELAATGRPAAAPSPSPEPAPAAPEPRPVAADADPGPRPAADPDPEPARPATPTQGRRRARDDDGLFDEFDEDGQSAGSLHRY